MLYFALLVLCIFAYEITKGKPKKQKMYALLFLFFLMLLVGVRDPSVGVDSERYAEKLTFVRDLTFESYEPLFQLSINFVNATWGTVLAWFLYLSFLAYFLYALAILKYSLNPMLSVLIFMVSFIHLFPDTMNNLRQGIAIMLLLLSYLTAANRKFWLCVPLFILAAGFHMSSFFALPFFFISFYNLSKSSIVSCLITSFTIGLVLSEFLDLGPIMSQLSFTSEVFMEGLDKFSGYTEGKRVLNLFGFLSVMAPLNVLCYLLIPTDSDDKSYKYLFNFYFWGIIIGNLIAGTISYGSRYMVIFLVVESVLFAYKYKKVKALKPFLFIMILLYCIYLIEIANKPEEGMIIPYKINPELFRIF